MDARFTASYSPSSVGFRIRAIHQLRIHTSFMQLSNAGSMLSLLAFPFVLEPRWNLGTQSRYWAIGYVLLALLIAFCALFIGRKQSLERQASVSTDTGRVPLTTRLEWVLLALIPSSLMLGVTTHIATDVASMPLIWIIPLALYLLTFILAFANRQVLSFKLATVFTPVFPVEQSALSFTIGFTIF